METLIAEFYAAFDNREGRPLDAAALRRMFISEAIITRVQYGSIETMSLEAFLEPRIQMLTDGTLTEFHEWEISATTTSLENIASRQSTYEKSGRLRGSPYEGRGQKLIQLVRAGGAWRITSILWEDSPTT